MCHVLSNRLQPWLGTILPGLCFRSLHMQHMHLTGICLQVHHCDCYLLIVIRLLIAVKGRTLHFAKIFCKRGCNLILQMFYACTGVWRRWVYQGVIDDPYGEFLVDENKSLQKVIVRLTLYWGSFTSLVWSLALTFADLSTYLVNLTS
jgi:hypothetical protein